MNRFNQWTALFGVSLGIFSCSDNLMQSKIADKTTISSELAATADSAGNYSAAIDPSSSSTQVLRASSGNVAGSAIAFPPGSLSIPVSVTIGEGESIASSSTTQQLGLSDNPASAAGPAVNFVPSSSVEASSPFTLAIPLAGTSLASLSLSEPVGSSENLVVIYKWATVVDGVTTYSIGILPRNLLTVGTKAVQFQTTKFGTFQLAVTAKKITERVNKPTDEPPVLKADATNPLVGVWSRCEERTGSGTNQTSTTTTVFGDAPLPPNSVMNSCVLPSSTAEIKIHLGNINIPSSYEGAPISISRTISGVASPVNGTAFIPTMASGVKTLKARVPGIGADNVIGKNDIISFSTPPGCYFRPGPNAPGGLPSKFKSAYYSNNVLDLGRVATMSEATVNGINTITFNLAEHGLTINEKIVFSNVSGSVGISPGTVYYIHSSSSTDFFHITDMHLGSNPLSRTAGPSGIATAQFIRANGLMSINFATGTDSVHMAAHAFNVGEKIVVTHVTTSSPSAGAPSGVFPGMTYEVELVDANYFKIKPIGGNVISFSATGTAKFQKLAKIENTHKIFAPGLFPLAANTPLMFTSLFGSTTPFVAHSIYYSGTTFANTNLYLTATAGDIDIQSANSPMFIAEGFLRRADCNDNWLTGIELICDGTNPVGDVTTTSSSTQPQGDQGGGGSDNLGVPAGQPLYSRKLIKFTNNTFIHASSQFDGPNCSGRMINRTEETGSYTLGTNNGSGIYPVTINLSTAKATIFPPAAVAYANANPTLSCGVSNWVSGVAKDLNTTTCKEDPNKSDHQLPTALKIEGNKLFFEEDGSFDPKDVMIKQ